MVRKKVDSRVRALIENGVKTNTRSFFLLVGDHGKDQVVNLHYILSKAEPPPGGAQLAGQVYIAFKARLNKFLGTKSLGLRLHMVQNTQNRNNS
ncbi:hypothetical protein JKP88DRAFT_161987 [Tribonema minus]|uniref:Uncharacterized protein n=1 Tax=Tribonema minus TaxID=303371 RepID=A0A835Z707_9STRA|nr:hypothetical protein JKP88DRAFT_161987 [Tribonema minus]